MTLDILLFIGFGVLLALILLFVYLKDAESNKKFERFERVIEDLNHQVHTLEHNLDLKMQENQKHIEDFLQKAKSTGTVSYASSISNNKNMIIALHKKGKKHHEIAKELRIGLGEVEFVLKMHNLV